MKSGSCLESAARISRAFDMAAIASVSDLASENNLQISPSKSPNTYSSKRVLDAGSWPFLIASIQFRRVFHNGSARLLTGLFLVVLLFVCDASALLLSCTPTSSKTSNETVEPSSATKRSDSILVYWRPYPSSCPGTWVFPVSYILSAEDIQARYDNRIRMRLPNELCKCKIIETCKQQF